MTALITRQLRRLAALIVLTALLAGAPIAIYTLGLPLLPDHVPTGSEIWARLTQRDTGQVFIGFLVIVGIVAWVLFTILVILDIAARITRRPAWHLPGLHMPQAAAQTLVGMLLAGTIATAATPAMAATLTALPQPAAATVSTATLSNHVASPVDVAVTPRHAATATAHASGTSHKDTATRTSSGRVWIVTKGDTLWDIAEQTLGDPLRYTEIAHLNEGTTQPDGRTFKAAGFISPGWYIRLPDDATLPAGRTSFGDDAAETIDVTVQPGDTLSQIALDTLGDANQYPAIAAANGLSNPDLIHPGQIIQISRPTAADGRDSQRQAGTGDSDQLIDDDATSAAGDVDEMPSSHTADSTRLTDTVPGTMPETPSPTDLIEPEQLTASHVPAHSNEEAPAPAAPPRQQIDPERPVPASNSTLSGAPRESMEDPARLPFLAGLTALAAAVIWAGLLLTRRRLQRSRRPGEKIHRPPLELEARVETALRRRADNTTPNQINSALRRLTPILAQHPQAGIALVLIGRDRLELRPATPAAPPEPLTGTDTTWHLAFDDGDDDLRDAPSALPTLVTIGTMADGRLVLLNLEHLGVLHIEGDQAKVDELVNHMIIELSQVPWTDGIHIHLADRDGLRALDSDRIQPANNMAGEEKFLAAHARSIRSLLDGRSLTQVRAETTYADAWEPHLLITSAENLGGDSGDIIDLLQEGPAAATAIITTGMNPGIAASLHIAADGTITAPPDLIDEPVEAAAATPTEMEALIGLFTAAEPNPEGDDGTFGEIDDDITPIRLDDDTDCRPDPLPTAVTLADPMPALINGSGPIEKPLPVTSVASFQPGGVREVESGRTLDADLAEWHSDQARRPKIAILGPAEITGLGPDPGQPQPRQKETAVYLALYSQGVTVDKFVTDLWPEGAPPTSSARRATISRLRIWLGNDPETGEPFIPNRENGYYLTDRLVDSELFARLVRRSERRAKIGDARDALDDLQHALDLVRGPILPESGGQNYSWLAAADRMEDRTLPMAVIDAAHSASDIALAIGDVTIAEAAAQIARAIDPYHPMPLCDLIRIARYCGDDSSAAGWAKAVLDVSEIDHPDDLPDHIKQVVIAALPRPHRP